MDDSTQEAAPRLRRSEISAAVADLGWRYILGVVCTSVRVTSLAQATDVVARVVAACGDDAGEHLWLDVRPDDVEIGLQTRDAAYVTPHDIELARLVSAAVSGLGLNTVARIGDERVRSVQVLEIGIDALDIARIRPFWKAVLGYADEVGYSGPTDPVVDPARQGPAIWFQQMDAPRPQRNRIHFDVSVPHDEAERRIRAALDAGGVLLSDARAPAFWVLADAEGNEACVTTWQARD